MVSRFILVPGKARVIVAGAIRITVPGVLSMRSSLTTDANAHRTTRGFVMTNPDLPGGRREEPAGPGRAAPDAGPVFVKGAGPAPGAACGEAPGPDGLPASAGRYEIRFRLAGWEALIPPLGLLCLAAGIFAPDSLYSHVVGIAFGGFLTVPYVIMLAGRAAVFRADQEGITLGPEVPMRQFSAEFFPWAEIKKITFYTITRWSRTPGKQPGTYIGIVPRTPPAGAARRINTWRLDPGRLAAVTAAAAPGVRIVEAGKIDPRTSTGMAVLRGVGR